MKKQGNMSSRFVYACYCKQDGNILHRKDNDANNENRHPTTIVSRKSAIRNDVCGSRESVRMLNTSRLVQSVNPVLSPETSIALEKAEKMVNSAKIKLVEISTTSNYDSTRSYKNIYLDDLPLDDEAEELLYIRELVTSKLQEVNSTGPEVNGKTRAHLGEFPGNVRVPTRRIDLSSPKFRMLQRRADRPSEYESNDRLLERASPSGALSKNSLVNDEASVRDDKTSNHRQTSAGKRELIRADGHTGRINACRIQIGPSVHVERELTKQDLGNVHISPDTSYMHNHANTATYTYVMGSCTFSDELNQTVMSRTPKMSDRNTRLAVLQRQKRGKLSVVEITSDEITNASEKSEKDILITTDGKDTDFGKNNEQTEFSNMKDVKQSCGDDRKNEEFISQTDEVSETFKHSKCTTNEKGQFATGIGKIANSKSDIEKSKITFCDNVEDHYIDNKSTFNKKIRIIGKSCSQNEENIDKAQAENQNNQSKSPPTNDISRKTGLIQNKNIASHYQVIESSNTEPCQTTDKYLLNTFNNHDEQNASHDNIATKYIRHRSFVPSCFGDFRAGDNTNEMNLYKPHLEDLDSILLSNAKKIEHVIHATKTFTELLSKPEFSKYKSNENEQMPPYCCKKLSDKSSVDKDYKNSVNKSAQSSTAEVELNHEDLTISNASSMPRTNTNPQETSAEIKSSNLIKENGYRSIYSKNSIESTVYPVSEVSIKSGMSHSDKVQQLELKMCLSESLSDKSNVTIFSNILPALSSTRTETKICHRKEGQITQNNDTLDHSDVHHHQSYVTSVDKSSLHGINSQEKYFDNVLVQELRHLKDTSEAADRFITYILQDEKQNVEKKIACALKESAITSMDVEKLLNNLRKIELISNAPQMDILDILKNILISVKNETDKDIDEKGIDSRTKVSEDTAVSSIRIEANTLSSRAIDEKSILREEDARQTEENIYSNEIEQNAKKLYDIKHSNGYSSDFSECRETRESTSLRSSSTLTSKNTSKSKRNSCSEGESLKQISDIRTDEEHPGETFEHSPPNNVLIKSDEDRNMEVNDNVITMFRNEKDYERKCGLESQCINKNMIQTIGNQIKNAHLDILRNTSTAFKEKEITIEKTFDNISADTKISEINNENLQSSANSSKPKSLSETVAKKDINPLHSLEKQDTKSECTIEKDVNFQPKFLTKERIGSADSCSSDSLQDCTSLHTISRIKDTKTSLKTIEPCSKETYLNIASNALSLTDIANNRIQNDSKEIAAIENCRDQDKSTEFRLNSIKNKDEQYPVNQINTLQTSLSGSSASINSISLDRDDRFNNIASSTNMKIIENSSETSHSEGELYMPSSCSYSLGEIKILKKCGSTDSTTNGSVTILTTKSMLTSLNNATSSLLGSSGHI